MQKEKEEEEKKTDTLLCVCVVEIVGEGRLGRKRKEWCVCEGERNYQFFVVNLLVKRSLEIESFVASILMCPIFLEAAYGILG